ncbi:STAS domain-containing protein [Domibacillus sp. DTU_2020_1001157_1_SI_ALB_TIR_016]|uniref:STAS domain-containing protein n=1 Tax=Domibacillus sp. DTU_2020_1001157_1_SI_ALB_TIR_016 TaxID=3077789 RepID=UPI0028E254FB|nr:STAS domain-containing protein [Domibacillus sp. DTU_2020_1001157_1_SI_ALB_TIR_016]WNS78791.1 STAS domain-containing protein [Domibacillus sp. DTU_2020_1001157_1_SI_ALB_TIR_016]
MEKTFDDYSFKFQEFLQKNSQKFEEKLLLEAVNVRDKIDEILSIGNIDLVNNAHKLVVYIINRQEKEVELFAKQEGIAWATHSLTLSFKLEWVQAIRRTIWNFIEQYNGLTGEQITPNFFHLEKEINNQVDAFLNAFFINYSTYKDSLIKAQRKLVENLSVPIIPINTSVCILPVIGSVDTFRTSILEEKVLTEIEASRIQTLIMDLSGIADMESQVIDHLTKIIDGASLMGCHTVITGLRADVVRKMIHKGLSFGPDTETLGTLQQALKEYLI